MTIDLISVIHKYKKLKPSEKKKMRRWMMKHLKSKGVRTHHLKVNKIIEVFIATTGSDPVQMQIDRYERAKAANDRVRSMREGYVYVFGNTAHGVCKIGFSTNPEKRMESIQTGCPYLISTIAIFEGTIEMEKRLHRKYGRYRLNGEWFRYDGDLKLSIEKKLKDIKTKI